MKNSVILNNAQIQHKTKRIAYQILESNSSEKEVVLAGIVGNGYVFAKRIQQELQEISDLKILLCEVQVNKKNPLEKINTSLPSSAY